MKPIPNFTEEQIATFWERVDKRGVDECWPWIGALGRNSRGTWSPMKPGWIATRVSYFLANGQDPGEFYVCHSCDNPNCVNPAHLWLGSQLDNIRDNRRKGRKIGPGQRAHCQRGHRLTGSNVYRRPDGKGRVCLACARMRNDRRAAVRKALGLKRRARFSIGDVPNEILARATQGDQQ